MHRTERWAEQGLFAATLLTGLTLSVVAISVIVAGISAAGAVDATRLVVGVAASVQLAMGALLLCLPLGVLIAVWLAFYLPPRLRTSGHAALSVMSRLPAVVFGACALLVYNPVGVSDTALAGMVLVGIMATPTVTLRAFRALQSVPVGQLEAALALGATRVHAMRAVILPQAWKGLLSAGVLGVVRAIGDTMAVWMVAGGEGAGSLLGPLGPLTVIVLSDLGPGDARMPAVGGAVLLVVSMWLTDQARGSEL